ncbi:MAG TPA: cation:dicarboxylase symporter family transporter [Blastocatellia bacterium]|nr:cation:dicarboxylase symporter family transporter [Blastocatellia bacterium]
MANFSVDSTSTDIKLPKRWRPSLTTWIMIGLVVGVVIGWAKPAWGDRVYFLRDIFLNLIKSIIAPLVFSTIVVGVAGGGDLKKVGRMGAKALVYFEIVTTIALFIGLGVVNLTRPGVSVVLSGDTSVVKSIQQTHASGFVDTIVHIFPASIVSAMASGDVLQIVAYSVIFAMAVMAMGKKGEPVLVFCESLSQIMFKFTSYVMLMAPIGVGAAMAHTVAHEGLDILKNLGMLIGSLYIALIIFTLLVLWPSAILFRIPIKQFLKAVKEPFTIAFVTTSSESALPKAMEVMERMGVPKRIVGFVMPTGYSFNLVGTTLYLAMASVFVAQAAEHTLSVTDPTRSFHMSFGQQIVMMITLMITSKGVAAVPRASLVILLATLEQFVPGFGLIGVAVIFGVDELMDMARTAINVLGNCLATAVVARWEGEFDDERARVFGTPDEIALEEALGEPALAEAAAQGD